MDNEGVEIGEKSEKGLDSRPVKKKRSRKRLIMMVVVIALVSCLGFIKADSVVKVKQSIPYGTTNTLGEYYSAAFGSVSWSQDEISEDAAMVTVKGMGNYNGENVEFEVDYKLDRNEYSFDGLRLNDIEQDANISYEFINQMEKLAVENGL